MNKSKRILSVLMTVVMLLSLMTGMFSVSAAEALAADALLVDDDFAGKAAGSAVSATVAGKTYNAVMGKTAFATIQDAVKASKENDTILVAAGTYKDDVKVPHSLKLFGNQKDVDPNDATDLSKRSTKRSFDLLDQESVLVDCVISYANYGQRDKDGNIVKQSGDVIVNGFALSGASTVTLQSSALSGATVEIACMIAQTVLDSAYDDKMVGTPYSNRAVFQINDASSFSDVAKKLVIRNNRVESVIGTSTIAVRSYFTNAMELTNNYFADTTGHTVQVNAVTGVTNIIGNYMKDGSAWQLCNGIGGEINVKNNTFDGLGGETANAGAAFLLYSDGSQTYRNWTDDAVVTVSHNKFLGAGKAMNVYSKVLNSQNASVNGPLYGLTIEENYFEPFNKNDFTFITFNNIATTVNNNPVIGGVPVVRNNYSGGENPVPLVSMGVSDAGAEIDFGPYYLDPEMTVSSSLMELVSVVSPTTAILSASPKNTIIATVPNEETELEIILNPAAGTSYKLYMDADCTIPVANDTLPLNVGANLCYAEITMGEYKALYTISVVRKAAFSVPLPSNELMVGPSFSAYPTGATVYQEINGQMYRATIGLSAYGTISEAIANQQIGDTIRVAPGVYQNELSIASAVRIVGPKAGINPNTSNWDLSDARSNPAEEAIFTNTILFVEGGANVYIDGISLIEGGCFRSATSNVQNNNVTVANIRQYDITTAPHGFFYRINGGTMDGLTIDQCRVEGITTLMSCLSATSNLTVKNSGFVNCTGNFWMGSNKGGAGSTIAFIDNGFINCDGANLISSSENSATSMADANYLVKGNLFKQCDGNYKVSFLGLTQGRNVEIVDNTLENCASAKNFATVSLHASASAANVKINRNTLTSGNYKYAFVCNNEITVDASKNYYGGSAPASGITSGMAEFEVYPFYSDAAMTTLVGAAEILKVNAPAAAVFDEDAKTITLSNVPDESVALNLTVTDGAKWTLYSDIACTNKIEGTSVRLTGSTTKAYVKVENEVYGSSTVYTVIINNPVNSKANLFGFIAEDTTFITENGVDFYAMVPNRSAIFDLQGDISYGAKFSVYSDKEMTKPLNFTEMFVPLGTTTFYVKVVSEDKSTTAKYTLTLTRDISDATDLFSVTNSENSAWDGDVLVGEFLYDSETIVPTFKVAGGATYQICGDIGGNILLPNDKAITLNIGDNIIFVKVIAEDGVTEKVYKVNLFRMNRSSEKSILASSIPEYTRAISNVAKRVDIFLTDFLSTIEVNLDVSPTATYSIFKSYDPITGVCTGSVSRQGAVQPISLVEGDNVFYIRLTAADNSVAVYTLTIHNEIRSTEAFILDAANANDFVDNGDGSFFASVGSATTALDLVISSKATAYAYADADHKRELECETTSTVDASTGITTTNASLKLNAMRYTTYYVIIESQVGNREEYKVVVCKDGIVPAASLADVAEHWAEQYITIAYGAGIVSGTEKGSEVYFEPNKSSTREQTAMFLLNLIGVNPDAYTGDLVFKDAAKVSKWAVPAVRAMYKLGIMKGDTNGVFRPQATITREEFMVVMAQVCDYDLAAYASFDVKKFSDNAKISSWALPYVKACVANGLISGNPDGTLNPKGAITRAQIVTIMAKCYEAVRAK